MTNRNLRSYPGANAVLPAEAGTGPRAAPSRCPPQSHPRVPTHSHDGGSRSTPAIWFSWNATSKRRGGPPDAYRPHGPSTKVGGARS